MRETAKKNRFLQLILIVLLACSLLSLAACKETDHIVEVPSDEEYFYVNPDETKAQPDAGFVIDGVLDEEAYKNNHWLYLHNDDGGNNVDIAMTSYFGEKGMYFVYDVTETVPIYVNLNRASYMNSCIEMYFAPSWVTSISGNSLFEVDLLPTGDMTFKMNNGKGGYVNVATTDENMAVLGTTTKGGPVNSEDCYGYCLELFIPWEYMEWVGMDTAVMKDSFVYVDPAHITSNNLNGTDTSIDRYWYFYAQQNGATFSNVYQYFRFNGDGVMGTVPVTLTGSEHVTLAGDPNVLPGVQTTVTVKPENGYALTSILVNGEEQIGKVSFNADGSVDLTVRGRNEGLEITAAAEAVTEGNKTLSGTVVMNKPGGDTFEGLLVTYIGPSGERPVEIAEDGSFVLADLPQGYYTLTAEKEGYQKLSRPVYLNRDMQLQLNLEFDTFMVQSGTSWILDDQNEGVLHKFGGQGYLMSNQSYDKFTFETYLFYDKELAKESDIDAFTQQRSGVRIQFSNGKFLYIDALKEGDEYILQYAKHSNSIFDKWRTVCVMDAHQASKYTGEEGIKLTVMRDRNYVLVWLNDEIVAVEKLDQEYAGYSAQLGFESWTANRQILEIPYSIQETTSVYVPGYHYTRPTAGWNITGQYWGSLLALSPDGDTGWLNTAKNNYRDVSVTVSDKTPDAQNFRMAVHFTFSNEETFRISLTNADSGELGVYKIQVMGANSIVKNWITPYRLTSAQIAKLQSQEGTAFRVAVVGETAIVYLDDVQVCALDLSKDTEGNATNIADKGAQIGLRLYGNEDIWSKIPLTLVRNIEETDIQVADPSQVVLVGDSHTVGEVIVLKPADEGCEFISLKIDGQEVTLTDKSQYTFVATQETHTVEGVSVRVRDWNPLENAGNTWDASLQENGVITSVDSTGDTGWMWTYENIYRDITLTLSDKTPADKNFRMGVHFEFTNGKIFRISLTNADTGAYRIQSMGANSIIGNWKDAKALTDAQVTKLQSDEGIAFRVVILGSYANVYLDGQLAYTYDLSGGDIADQTAKIAVRLYGNTGVAEQVAYTLGGEPESGKVTVADMANGAVTVSNPIFLPGDPITLTVAGDNGYYHMGLLVNGTPVTVAPDGTCTFTATENSYHVATTFAAGVFEDYSGHYWQLVNQNVGMLHVPSSCTGNTQWIETAANCNEIAAKYQDLSNGGNKNYAMALQLYFENGKYVSVRIIDEQQDGTYVLQSMGDSAFNWGIHYNLNDEQNAKVRSQGVWVKLSRVGTTMQLYIDDVLVASKEMTGRSSGITADMSCVAKIRYYNVGYAVDVPYTLGEPVQTGKVTVTQSENGTITADKETYEIGETVTLTVAGNDGFCYKDLKVNGVSVTVNDEGKYTFTTTGASYTVTGSFTENIFIPHSDWNVIHQGQGYVKIPATQNGAYWMQTKDNWNELVLTVKDYAAGAVHEYAVVGQLYFENDKVVSIRLIYDKNNNVYNLQSMGDSVFKWAVHHTLTAEQAAKVQADGIEFRMTRVGTTLNLFLDGELVKKLDLTGNNSGITANMTCVAKIRYYNSQGYNVKLPFAVANPDSTVTVSVKATENGKVTADKTSCQIGDTVTLTVTGDSGYYHTGLKVNGKTVSVDPDGTYTFTATQDTYEVSTTFTAGVFEDYSGHYWQLVNQNVGMLHVPSSCTGNTKWIETAANCNEIAAKYQDLSNGGSKDYAMALQLYFENGKYVSVRIIDEQQDGTYVLQSMGDSAFNWGIHYNLNDEQNAKVRSQGVWVKLSRVGTTMQLYIDDVLVASKEMTGRSSGITATMNCVAKIRYYNVGYAVDVPYTLGNPAQVSKVTVAATSNGTVTADKESYAIGDTVTLTVTPDTGYSYSSLKVNGKSVDLGWDGTYSFTAEQASYDVTASFASNAFTGGDTRHWNLFKHHVGELMVKSHTSGHSGWIDYTGTTNDVTVRVKDHTPDAKNFTMTFMFKFSNGETFNIRLHGTDGAGVYKIQSMNSTLFAAWKNRYTLSDEETEKVKGDGITFRVIILNKVAHVYLDGVHVCEYDLTSTGKNIDNTTTTVTLRMDGNLNHDVYMTYNLANTTALP